MLKVRTLFSGIGSPEIALRDLQMPYELVDFCEFDKYAIKSYCAVHGVPEDKNLGDISKVWGRNLPYADLLVWGFPCTDISVAGKQAGIIEGETRSGLYYEGLRILRETKPKYSVIENVKNLTGKQFKKEFEQMLKDIDDIGYNNYWKVLNAKDFEIPQNRERVFIVSIRKDIDIKFEFPVGFDNGLRLKDFLEDEVEEKFYISAEKTEKLISQLKDRVIVKEATKKGYSEATDGDSINLEQPNSLTRRGRIGHQKANTLTCSCNQAVVCSSENKIEVVGNLSNTGHHGLDVYSENGISPTLKARDFKDPVRICVPGITPNRVEKRQNGRRFKEDGDPMFTLTSQDRHGILQVGELNSSQDGVVHDVNGISQCLSAGHGNAPKVIVKEATKKGYAEATVGDSINIQFPGSETRRGRVGHEIANTLETSCNQAVIVAKRLGGIFDTEKSIHQAGAVWDKEGLCPTLDTMQGGYRQPSTQLENYRIRRLTPKECWRLMGFQDEDFQKAVDAGVSNSQLYEDEKELS